MKLEEMGIAQLSEYQGRLEERAKELKSDLVDYKAELARRFGDLADASMKKAGKTHGSLTDILPEASGYRLFHKTPVKVEWDSDRLTEWAAGQPWQTVQHYCRVKFEVRESVWRALSPDDQHKEAFRAARSEKIGATSFELVAPSS